MVFTLIFVILYSWSTLAFFNYLPSWLLFLDGWTIAGIFAYSQVFALFESLLVPVPPWCEGRPLPLSASDPANLHRTIYALDARRNSAARPLSINTIAMIKGRQKLIAYYGYPGYDHRFELYDVESDPEERHDLSEKEYRAVNQLIVELETTLQAVNLPFRA